MLGPTHAYMAGTAGALIAALAFPGDPGPGLFFTAVTFASGLACDLDQPGSYIALSYGILTGLLARAVHRLSGGHREGMHELPGEAITAGLAWVCAAFIHDRWAQLVLGIMLAILAAAALEVVRVHRAAAGLAGIGAAVAVVTTRYQLALIGWAILTGMIVHVAGDSLTKDGTTPLKPFWHGKVRLLPRRLLIKTGHKAEKCMYRPVFASGFIAALGFVVWRDAGAIAAIAHARLAQRGAG